MQYPYSVINFVSISMLRSGLCRRWSYRIPFLVLLRIDAGARSAVGGHRLIPVLAKMEYILLLVVMHALDDLGPYK